MLGPGSCFSVRRQSQKWTFQREGDTETSATVESPLPQTVEPVDNRVTFPLDNSGETPQAAASSSSPPSQNDSSVEDEPEVNITRLPAPETKTTNIAASDPANTDSRTPAPADYFRNRASLRRQLGDLEGSMEDDNQALSVNQNDSIAYNIRGIVKEEMGDLEGAQKDFDRAIGLRPDEPTFYQNRSALRRKMGGLEEAQADLDRAVSLRSDN